MSDTEMSENDLTKTLANMDETLAEQKDDSAYTGEEETEEILTDPDTIEALARADEDMALGDEGRTPWGDVVPQMATPDAPSPTGRFQASFDRPLDNIEAAMDKLAETLDPKVSKAISDDDGPADKQVLIRSTARDHERWKLAAEREGKSLSAFIREIVNNNVADILDCSHPLEFRQSYPWSETCLKCGTRLRDGGDNSPNSATGRRG